MWKDYYDEALGIVTASTLLGTPYSVQSTIALNFDDFSERLAFYIEIKNNKGIPYRESVNTIEDGKRRCEEIMAEQR